MTAITNPIKRETATRMRGKPIIVELHPGASGYERKADASHSISITEPSMKRQRSWLRVPQGAPFHGQKGRLCRIAMESAAKKKGHNV